MFHRKHFAWLATLTLMLVARSGAVRADTPGDTDKLFDAGAAAFDDGRYEEAAGLWAKVWEKKRTYDVASALAQSEIKLARWTQAAEHLAFALESFPVTGKQELRTTLEAAFADARQKVAEVSFEVTGSIDKILVDGAVLATNPDGASRFFLLPGRHELDVTVGSASEKRVLQAKAGGKHAVKLDSTAQRPKPAVLPLVIAGSAAIGGVALGIGGIVVANDRGAGATKQRNDVVAGGVPCPTAPGCAALKQTLYDQRTMETVAGIGLGLAGAAIAAGAVYLLLPRAPDLVPAIQVQPVAGQTGGGLILHGHF